MLNLCSELKRNGAAIPDSVAAHVAGVADPVVLSDVVAHTFVTDAQDRQRLLEQPSSIERLRILVSILRAQLG